MARQLNPFVYGKPVPPTHFIGRDDVIDNCYNRLAGPVRTSIAISGEHGIGKTSFLHNLKHTAQEENWGQPYIRNIFVYVNCQAVEQFSPTRFWRRVLELLKEAEDSLVLHQQLDTFLKEPELDATHIQRLLRWLSQQSLALVLLLDSFTGIVKTTPDHRPMISDFLAGLRALTNLPDHALTLITATRQSLNILCADIVKDYPGSYFYNNFAFESLVPFTPAEIETLFEQAFAQIDFNFDQDDQAFLHDLAGAHPALLQIASYYLFDARRQAPLNEPTYKKVIEEFERAARNYFSLFWDEASPLERTLFILTLLLGLSKQSSFQAELNDKEIYHLLQRYERTLMHLIERGLIQQIEDSYQIFSAVFNWWIVREVTRETEAELADRHKTISDESLRRAWQTLKKLAPLLTLDKVTQMLIKRPAQLDSSSSSSQSRPTIKESTKPWPDPQKEPAAVSPRYKLQEMIGRGANGAVYKAFDHDLARTVAIKLLHSSVAIPTEDNRRSLLKEARAASQLQHPYIVTVYDVTELNNYICLVMEYVKGQTLADLLLEKERLPLRRVIALIDQAAKALDYAHTQNVIHRDIKPANLLITDSGELKLTDFGIAKIIDEPQTVQSTGLKGTVIYMSPEQINQQTLDGRSDLFSLATVAFEMLSGASPWPGKFLELMNNIASSPPLSPAKFGVPDADALEPIFQKALTKDPAERYQRGEHFVQALKSVITR